MIPRRIIRPAIALLVAAAASGLAGCDWMPGKPTQADKPVIESTITNFQQLWTTNCSGCHGADGRWGPARPLNDPLYLALASDDYLLGIITDGVDNSLMPPMAIERGGHMTAQQITDLIKGMRTHWTNPEAVATLRLPPLSAAIGKASAGGATFATYCGVCHGDDGTGAIAGSVVDTAFLGLVSDQALRSAIICGRLDLGMPNYAGYAGGHRHSARTDLPALTTQQIGDIVAWLASHRVEFPGQPYPDTNTLSEASTSE